jgi:hypothetical protein
MEKTNSYQPMARKEKLVIEQMANEVLVYDLERHKAHCLNLTAAVVWQHCNGKNNIAKITHLVSRDFQTTVSEDIVLLALNQLDKFNLLEKKKDFGFSLPKVTRRDVMKRMGLASVIAIPLVSSIIAPTALASSSCINQNCTVGTPGTCPPSCTCSGGAPGSPGNCI